MSAMTMLPPSCRGLLGSPMGGGREGGGMAWLSLPGWPGELFALAPFTELLSGDMTLEKSPPAGLLQLWHCCTYSRVRWYVSGCMPSPVGGAPALALLHVLQGPLVRLRLHALSGGGRLAPLCPLGLLLGGHTLLLASHRVHRGVGRGGGGARGGSAVGPVGLLLLLLRRPLALVPAHLLLLVPGLLLSILGLLLLGPLLLAKGCLAGTAGGGRLLTVAPLEASCLVGWHGPLLLAHATVAGHTRAPLALPRELLARVGTGVVLLLLAHPVHALLVLLATRHALLAPHHGAVHRLPVTALQVAVAAVPRHGTVHPIVSVEGPHRVGHPAAGGVLHGGIGRCVHVGEPTTRHQVPRHGHGTVALG